MGWTESNKTEPQGDWGQGSVNNAIEWGRAALNNAINWGWGHSRTLGHAVTNLVGGGGLPFSEYFDFAFKSWGDLPDTKVLYTANEVRTIKSNFDWIKLDNSINISGDFDLYLTVINTGVTYPVGSIVNTRNYIQINSNTAEIKVNIDNTLATFSVSSSLHNNKVIHLERKGNVGKIYVDGILQDTQPIGTGIFSIDNLGRRTVTYSTISFRWVFIPQVINLEFNEGAGTVIFDKSGNKNNGHLKGTATWNLGVDTIIDASNHDPLLPISPLMLIHTAI